MIDRLYSESLKMNWCMEVKIPCASFCSNVKQNFNSGDSRTIYCQFPFSGNSTIGRLSVLRVSINIEAY